MRGAAGAARRSRHRASGARHLDHAVGPQHVDQAVDLVLAAGDLDGQRVRREIDDAGAEDLGQVHDLRPASCGAVTLIIASSRKTAGLP